MNAAANIPQASAIKSACDDMVFEAIIDTCDLAASYARSASEAAWRGDRRLLAGHLAQLRLTVITALDFHKRLGALPDGGAHG